MKILLLITLFCTSCTMPIVTNLKNDNPDLVTIITWNLQTFFDAQTQGTEYDEFKSAKTKWNEQRYIERLTILCNVIEKTKADVFVFQEIENSAILQDISNKLASNPIQYAYSSFSKNKDDALGIAIMSRFPLKNNAVHHIDYRAAMGFSDFETSKDILDGTLLEQPSMRGILFSQVEVDENKSFSLYACHWKSKYGGAEKSEVWRNAQERLLADILLLDKNEYVVTGDFNRTLEEFVQSTDDSILLRGSVGHASVLSAWNEYSEYMQSKGSYFYQGVWEKIDHFFYSENLEVIDFNIVNESRLTTNEGFPYRYDIYTGKGVSDHMPLVCVIEL